MITQARLKELLNYDPETGIFTRLTYGKGNFYIGSVAGGRTKNRYIAINLDKKIYLAHRLAHLYMTGKLPKDQIDHINNIRDDNRWCNLREATRAENMTNRGPNKNSKTNVKGVSICKNGYLVMFCVGTYKTLEEAKDAYAKMAILYHGEFVHKSITG